MGLFEWNNNEYEERQKQIEEDDARATEHYNDGMYLYNIAHYSDAKCKFNWALECAHDEDIIKDCKEMIDKCNECLFEIYMT